MGTRQLPSDYEWKLLGHLTDDLAHLLTDSDEKLLRSAIRSRSREQYRSLSERWGLQSWALSGGKFSPERAALYSLGRILAKFRSSQSDAELRRASEQKLLSAERTCSEFNRFAGRKLARRYAEWDGELSPATADLLAIKGMRQFIRQVIGESLPDVEILTRAARHGPGSAFGTRGGQVSTYYKYSRWPYTVTKSAVCHARSFIDADPRWKGALEDSYREKLNIPAWKLISWEPFWLSVLKETPRGENRVCHVPKDDRTDRPIAIEPMLNVMLQLGVDGFIRRRLKRFGVDLDDQSKNRELARLGSLYGSAGAVRANAYATIDLASASDTVSLRVCKLLLPREWYEYLTDIRSSGGVVGGRSIRYSKISSMGNGYTFALESLIFAAVARQATKMHTRVIRKRDYAVFGDDIIVREDVVPNTLWLLSMLGFTINNEKSFYCGSVKESCGTDWVQGINVRPVHLKQRPRTMADVLTDRNRIARLLECRFGIPLEESSTVRWLDRYLPAFPRGPLSDESFSNWVHSRRPTESSNSAFKQGWVHRWNSVTQVPRKQGGKEFLFRKLMCLQRQVPSSRDLQGPLAPNWLLDAKGGSGDAFLIHKRNCLMWKMARSAACIWQTEYDDRVTLPSFSSD